VASSAETDDQLAFLQGRGCQRFQFHLFGRPMPVAAIEEWLS